MTDIAFAASPRREWEQVNPRRMAQQHCNDRLIDLFTSGGLHIADITTNKEDSIMVFGPL